MARSSVDGCTRSNNTITKGHIVANLVECTSEKSPIFGRITNFSNLLHLLIVKLFVRLHRTALRLLDLVLRV